MIYVSSLTYPLCHTCRTSIRVAAVFRYIIRAVGGNMLKTATIHTTWAPQNLAFWKGHPPGPSGKSRSYSWWTKSCTTWDNSNPIDNGIIIILGGAGFCPSTVGCWSITVWPDMTSCRYRVWACFRSGSSSCSHSCEQSFNEESTNQNSSKFLFGPLWF